MRLDALNPMVWEAIIGRNLKGFVADCEERPDWVYHESIWHQTVRYRASWIRNNGQRYFVIATSPQELLDRIIEKVTQDKLEMEEAVAHLSPAQPPSRKEPGNPYTRKLK